MNHSVVDVCAARAEICVRQARQRHTPPWIYSKYQEPAGPISRSRTASTPLHSSTTNTSSARSYKQGRTRRSILASPCIKSKVILLSLFFELIHESPLKFTCQKNDCLLFFFLNIWGFYFLLQLLQCLQPCLASLPLNYFQ